MWRHKHNDAKIISGNIWRQIIDWFLPKIQIEETWTFISHIIACYMYQIFDMKYFYPLFLLNTGMYQNKWTPFLILFLSLLHNIHLQGNVLYLMNT